MSTFSIEFTTDNAAFEDPEEIPRILNTVIDRVQNGLYDGVLIDGNGNSVGRYAHDDGVKSVARVWEGFHLNFETDNYAFTYDTGDVASRVGEGAEDGRIFDFNGNSVGSFERDIDEAPSP